MRQIVVAMVGEKKRTKQTHKCLHRMSYKLIDILRKERKKNKDKSIIKSDEMDLRKLMLSGLMI